MHVTFNHQLFGFSSQTKVKNAKIKPGNGGSSLGAKAGGALRVQAQPGLQRGFQDNQDKGIGFFKLKLDVRIYIFYLRYSKEPGKITIWSSGS